MVAMPTMSLVDSHCHLNHIDLSEFNHDMDVLMQRARDEGVRHMLCVCTELSDLPAMHQLAAQYKDVSISVGIHPNTEMPEELNVAGLTELASHPACIAIGETGLDYYRTETEDARERQRSRFRTHIDVARTLSKPLIIHTRQAADDTLLLMAEEKAKDIGGVMHCFSESWEVACRALDLNFYISLSGIVTFKNAVALQELAKKIPMDRLLIETDAPYLAPVPFRGKQNHPALVKHVAIALSELRQMDVDALAEQTTENFYRCFGLKQQ